jgi:hypothetical protein
LWGPGGSLTGQRSARGSFSARAGCVIAHGRVIAASISARVILEVVLDWSPPAPRAVASGQGCPVNLTCVTNLGALGLPSMPSRSWRHAYASPRTSRRGARPARSKLRAGRVDCGVRMALVAAKPLRTPLMRRWPTHGAQDERPWALLPPACGGGSPVSHLLSSSSASPTWKGAVGIIR